MLQHHVQRSDLVILGLERSRKLDRTIKADLEV